MLKTAMSHPAPVPYSPGLPYVKRDSDKLGYPSDFHHFEISERVILNLT